MKKLFIAAVSFIIVFGTLAQAQEEMCNHKVYRDSEGKILSWYKPDIPGAGYDHVVKLASEFIKSGCPIEPSTGLKLYLVCQSFRGPHLIGEEKFRSGQTGANLHNPACVYAGFVQGLVLDYRVYSGDDSYIGIVRECLDRQIDHGTTPGDWEWAKCPYASANGRSPEYFGSTRMVGERGDGPFTIEPDKVGEIGIMYVKFYEVTGEKKYLQAGIDCADALALAKHMREDYTPGSPRGKREFVSPWPYRVYAPNGQVLEEYTSNVVESVRLFDELIRIKEVIGLDPQKAASYSLARQKAWDWLFSTNGPMKTYIWKGYFEDVPNDPNNANRVEITPMETARYILKHPEYDSRWRIDVTALLNWVASAFGIEGRDAITEQFWCYDPMGSHTARYASINALMYEKTGEERYKDEAFRFFNFASYMTDNNGVVWVGPEWESSWFSDGYGDYIRHFMEGLAAVPEWAPADKDHLLKSTSVVQKISYEPAKISYTIFDQSSTEVLRITKKPKSVTADGRTLSQRENLDASGWTWKELKEGGVLRIRHESAREMEILK